MTINLESKNIEQLLAEADELLQRIDSGVLRDMQEDHRLLLRKHAQDLKRIKLEAEAKIAKKGKSKKNAGAEGMHEAILDIVTAVGQLKKYLS